MSQKTRFTQSALAVAVALVSTQAWSAGFQLNEFSASGLGRAYSGEGAIADDAGNASRNPALIMMFDRPTMSAGAVFVDPGVNVSGTSPTGKSLKADNIAPTAWVPNFHFVAPINDQFGWGASITSNYGLATEYNDDYAAGSMGGKTDLTTANFNLSGAYRLDSNWSFGLGFDAVYAKAKIERYAGDLGQIVAGSGALPPALAGNLIGTAVAAWAFNYMPIFDEPTRQAFVSIAEDVMKNSPTEMFANAIISGWLVATMVWMFPVAGAAKIVVIILMTWLIALADTTHIVVGSVEILYLVFNGNLPWSHFIWPFALPTLAGNICGGTFIFALLSHAQIRNDMSSKRKAEARAQAAEKGKKADRA